MSWRIREPGEPLSEREREDLALSGFWDDGSVEPTDIAEHEADADEAPQRSRQDFRLRGAR